jgi:hypothetical protein
MRSKEEKRSVTKCTLKSPQIGKRKRDYSSPRSVTPSSTGSDGEEESEEEGSIEQDPDSHLRRASSIKRDEEYVDDSEASLDNETHEREPIQKVDKSAKKVRQTPARPVRKMQPWSEAENVTVVRAMIKAGEANIDWRDLVYVINSNRAQERTLRSLQGHWTETLRKRHLPNDESQPGTPRKKKHINERASTVERSPSEKRVKNSKHGKQVTRSGTDGSG